MSGSSLPVSYLPFFPPGLLTTFFFLIKCIYIFFSCLNWIAFSFFWNLFIHLDYLLSCYLFYEFLAKLFYFLLFCWLHCMWDIPVNRNNKKKKKKQPTSFKMQFLFCYNWTLMVLWVGEFMIWSLKKAFGSFYGSMIWYGKLSEPVYTI